MAGEAKLNRMMEAGTFDEWMAALEARHLADLTFSEVARALRALSSTYVERRGRIREGAALAGAGKRAAFALFYGPLHYLLVREITRRLEAVSIPPTIVDLGCGTGAAGAAWAGTCVSSGRETPAILAFDRHRWALEEAAWTYRAFGLRARTRLGDIAAIDLATERARGPSAFAAAFALNELPDAARDAMLAALLERARHGDRVLVVEPLARSAAPWWGGAAARATAAGGRADEWRFRLELPAIVAKLDRAAGLDHAELTARTLFL